MTTTKKTIIIAAVMILTLFLLTACGGNRSPAPAKDPCACCPDCIQEECICDECGGNDEYACVCAAADSGGTWTISFKDVTDSSPQAGAEGLFAQDITLYFEASNLGEGGFSGQYSGEGKMKGVQDSSGYESLAGGLIEVNSDWAGPIAPVSFEITNLTSGTPNDDESLKSLTPKDVHEKLIGHASFSAAVDGSMGESWYQEHVVGTGMDLGSGTGFTLEVKMHILIYDGGTSILYMTVPGLTDSLMYRGTITKE